MGTEYYLVKPSKQETFYLGKHVQPIDCIRNRPSAVDYIDVDCFSDFFLQIIESNDGFLDDEYTYKDIKDFAYLLYEWCDAPVFMSSDCSNDYELFKDYKETGSIIDFCTKHLCYKDLLDDFVNYMPLHKVYRFEDGSVDYERSLASLL